MESESRNLKDIISGSASAASGVVETKSEDNLKDEVKSSSIGTASSMSTSREDDGKRVKRRVDKDDHIHKDDYSHKKDDQIGKKEEFTFKSKSSFGNLGSLKTSGVNATPVSTFAVATAATSVTTSTMATNPTLSVTTEACEANAGAMMIPTTTMCESSENDDSFRCSVGSPGPKVPPLKIVIPPSESAEQGNRNGKTVTRHHGGLPYIVVSNDESGAASSTCPSSPALTNVKDDDSSTPCNVNLSNDEQRIQQRILRSTNSNKITPNSNNDGNNNGEDCTANNTNSNNGTHYSCNVDGDGIPASCGTSNDDIKGSAAITIGDCDTNATSSAGGSSTSNDNGLCTTANLGGHCHIRDSGGNSTTYNANNVDYGSHIGNNSGSRASINNSNSSKGPANNTTIPNTTSTSSITSVNNGSAGGSDGGSSSSTINNNSITSHSNVAGDRTKDSQECSSGSNSSETSRNSSPATLEMSPLGDTSINTATFSGHKEDGSGGGGAVKSKTDSGSSAKSSGPKIESGGNLATMKMKNESSGSSNSKAKNDLEDDSNKVGASGDAKNTTAATGAATLATGPDMQSKEVSVPVVELHPRKRKLKSKQEISHTIAEGDHSISFGSAPHPHEVPVTNCYQMFMDIRRQIDVKRKGLFPIQPKPPQGFKDYLMNRCTYTLAGNSIPRLKRRNAEPPEGIDDRLKDLYQEQEAERYSLRMQHVVEKEKLVLSVEQEILRVHGRAARALANQALPFSACTILKDEEVYNVITPEQEEKDRNARSRYNGRLFISWLQDVDDKWEKIKEEMLARHHKEAESLNAVQKFNWDLKMRQQGLWKKKNTTPIDESHVPMISVSDDFDLLPE